MKRYYPTFDRRCLIDSTGLLEKSCQFCIRYYLTYELNEVIQLKEMGHLIDSSLYNTKSFDKYLILNQQLEI